MPSITADFSEQARLADLRVPEAVTVIGTGGSGSWAALFAALAGVKRLQLIDKDVVKATDLAKLPVSASWLGCKKVEALAHSIRTLRPLVNLELRPIYFDLPDHESILAGTIINAAAAPKLHAALPGVCERLKLRYMSGGYGGLGAGAFAELPPKMTIAEDAIPSWSVGCALAGGLMVLSAFHTQGFATWISPRLAMQDLKSISTAALQDLSPGDGVGE